MHCTLKVTREWRQPFVQETSVFILLSSRKAKGAKGSPPIPAPTLMH